MPNSIIRNPDAYFMSIAFKLAKKSDPFPNPRVGAVLVAGNRVLGVGHHKASGQPHAEIVAIENAKKKYGPDSISGSTLYVTLEPCSHSHLLKRTPPCISTIIREGIGRVVYAMKDPNPFVRGKGVRELRVSGIDVSGPTNEYSACSFNKKYIRAISQKPFVSIKMAMSADGKTATRTGDSKWISCQKSRDYVHRLRAKYDAVMVGAGTVHIDNPKLTTHGLGRDPYRIIIDGKLTIPLQSRILGFDDNKTIVVTTNAAPLTKRVQIRNLIICGKAGKVDLKKLVYLLGAMGLKKILLEGGSELCASSVEAGIVDQITLFIAPKLIGGITAKPVLGALGIRRMSQAMPLKLQSIQKLGTDLMLDYVVVKRNKKQKEIRKLRKSV